MIGFAAKTGYDSKKLLDGGVTSTGKVVSFEVKHEKDKKKNKTMYYPIVSFKDKNGRELEFRSNTGSNPKSYRVGEIVEVIYRKDNSDNAKINSFSSMWLLPLILSIFGCIIAGIGFIIPRSN